MRATNAAFLRLSRRAEAGDEQMLVDTFVDVGNLSTLLSSPDHQVLYGRRGTGKTHAFSFLRAWSEERGDVAALIDLRTIGSTGGIYGDSSVPISERGTRLLMDVLGQLHDALTDFALERAEHKDVTPALNLLDRLGVAITEVRVVGEHETRTVEAEETNKKVGGQVRAKIDVGGPRAEAGIEASRSNAQRTEATASAKGTLQHRVHFGEVSKVLQRLVEELPVKRVWILLDEWAAIPLDLQPLLADLLRHAVFPVRGAVVKIAAIEQRSKFQIDSGGGDYVGIELGADAQADLSLDDFMVFGNDPEAAKNFFRELLYRHVTTQMTEEEEKPSTNARDFQREAFTQRNAFDELVRAAEGVPRDAINIVRGAAQRAGDDPISVEHVRTAARWWYLTDKEKDVQANSNATALLHWITDTVIGDRRARAFLLEQGAQAGNPLITDLYDARVLHVIKRSVSSRDEPGKRYDVYALDFGCYVDLIRTAKAPEGLYEAEGEGEAGWVTVPADDYRSIRRAILDLDAFDKRPLMTEERTVAPRPNAEAVDSASAGS